MFVKSVIFEAAVPCCGLICFALHVYPFRWEINWAVHQKQSIQGSHSSLYRCFPCVYIARGWSAAMNLRNTLYNLRKTLYNVITERARVCSLWVCNMNRGRNCRLDRINKVIITMHSLRILTLANDQLDAQMFNTFVTILYMYMFGAISCSSSGGQIVLIQHLVPLVSVSDSPVHRFSTCAPDCHLLKLTVPDVILTL